jgi:ubiquinone/menaquinone biosynthesis C-methylase UbiE
MPDSRLRDAWTTLIKAEDYDAHMAAIGQAQANAELLADLFARRAPAPGAAVLIVGAGTGQIFDYAPAAMLAPYRTTFSDISPHLLEKLKTRVGAAPELKFETIVDDIENSRLLPGFELVIAILVLEHVDWQKAVATMCRLSTARVFVVFQENPPDVASAMTKSRPAIGSMQIFRELNPHLVPKSEVEGEFKKCGFDLRDSSFREVLDGKRMIALEFEPRS